MYNGDEKLSFFPSYLFALRREEINVQIETRQLNSVQSIYAYFCSPFPVDMRLVVVSAFAMGKSRLQFQ